MPIYRSAGVLKPRSRPARLAIGPNWPRREDAADCCCCGGMMTAAEVYMGGKINEIAAAAIPPASPAPAISHLWEAAISNRSKRPGDEVSAPLLEPFAS